MTTTTKFCATCDHGEAIHLSHGHCQGGSTPKPCPCIQFQAKPPRVSRDEEVGLLLVMLRENLPEVNEREAHMFDFIARVWGYLPASLVNLQTGEHVTAAFNDWLRDTYGFTLVLPEGQPRRRRGLTLGEVAAAEVKK